MGKRGEQGEGRGNLKACIGTPPFINHRYATAYIVMNSTHVRIFTRSDIQQIYNQCFRDIKSSRT
jgi:hypothetical protein